MTEENAMEPNPDQESPFEDVPQEETPEDVHVEQPIAGTPAERAKAELEAIKKRLEDAETDNDKFIANYLTTLLYDFVGIKQSMDMLEKASSHMITKFTIKQVSELLDVVMNMISMGVNLSPEYGKPMIPGTLTADQKSDGAGPYL